MSACTLQPFLVMQAHPPAAANFPTHVLQSTVVVVVVVVVLVVEVVGSGWRLQYRPVKHPESHDFLKPKGHLPQVR
jgi:hypothetical protein